MIDLSTMTDAELVAHYNSLGNDAAEREQVVTEIDGRGIDL